MYFTIIFLILFAFDANSQTSSNPNISNIRIDGNFNPGGLGGEPNFDDRRRPSANPEKAQDKSEIINLEKQNDGNQVKIIQADNPFEIKLGSQNSNQPEVINVDENGNSQVNQTENFKPFNNYEFTKENLAKPANTYGTDNYNNPQSELYQRAKNPNFIDAQQPSQKFEEVKESCDDRKEICIKYFISPEIIVFEAANKSPTTKTISMMIWNSNSVLKYMVRSPEKIILRGKENIKIAEIYVNQNGEEASFNFNFKATDGFIDAIHDNSYVYALPFEPGKTFKMIQGYGGKFSHTDEENYFSYDFRMPTGTPVFSAREGVVVKVREYYADGGLDARLREKSNFVHIEHEDGTIGIYAHLARGGASVNIGDYVQKGQMIGFSGNTGYSGSPHLHFAVAKVKKNGKMQSLPIRMQTQTGVFDRLKEGEYLVR
ncbi:MAG: M23 family metallopeptidase [Rickettsiales bacterium]|nr:M23 family metallopeptidase [Rickettsiales bacterium]